METTSFERLPAATRPSEAVLPAPDFVWHEIPPDRCRLDLHHVVYSIRLPRHPRRIRCDHCGTAFLAAGPTGYADDRPICDPCMLESEKELGMVLALVSIVRTYGAMRASSPQQHWDALELMGAFARIYERFAFEHSGPGRPFRPRRFRRRQSG